jgi:hypothetical protein
MSWVGVVAVADIVVYRRKGRVVMNEQTVRVSASVFRGYE